MRRTKIVCTLGPAVESPAQLDRLILAGMDVARFNFSHGTQEQHRARFDALHSAAQRTGKRVAALQDLCGPKLRVGTVAEGTVLTTGATVILTQEALVGDATRLPLPIPAIFAVAQPGHRLLLDDGLLELQVTAVTERELTCVVLCGGPISSGKGVNAPGIPLPIRAITEKDEADLRFGLSIGVDYVALSFVRAAEDVHALRQLMATAGRTVPILVKVEKAEAIENLEAILDAADGAMVARGDLGVELPIDQIPMIQKRIIRGCNRRGKPVITATQMLDSMIRNPRPTRAEVTDIANAILDGTDALMLSGETAVGAHPIEAVETMARVADTTEAQIDYHHLLVEKQELFGRESVTDAVAEAAATIAQDQDAAAIVCATETGGTARSVAKFRPRAPILAVTPREETCRVLALYRGVYPLLMGAPPDTDALLRESVRVVRESGLVRDGNLLVITSGTPVGRVGSTNLIKVHRIGDPL